MMKNFQEIYLLIFLAVQDFSVLVRKASFLLQESCKICARFNVASFARKILARLAYFLQYGFHWENKL